MIEKTLPSALASAASPQRYGDLPMRLLNTITELTELIQQENTLLADGLPASLASNIERKFELSEDYEDQYGDLMDVCPDFLKTEVNFTEVLIKALTVLRQVTSENLTRLEAAKKASKLRVEAVMTAVKSAGQEKNTYTAKGEIPLNACLAAMGKDFHA